MSRFVRISLFVVVAMLTGGSAWAQITGVVRGRVTDAQAAVLPGATVP